MKAILFDGSLANDICGKRVCEALTLQLPGWDIEYVVLRDKKIGNCSGDFFCWIRSPGMCHLNDDNRELAGAIVTSDLLVYLTPVTFGGYSSVLKRMVDHQIQNISPFFVQIDGETHHVKRYENYPDFLVVGWMEKEDDKAGTVFRRLVQRNAINFYAQNFVSDVILTSQPDEHLAVSAKKWVRTLQNSRSSKLIGIPAENITCKGDIAIRRALLLVGSPRNRKSNSNSIGEYLFEQLNAQGVESETVNLYTLLRSAEQMEALFSAIDSADLVVLVFPLYVDSLPAPVIDVLEQIALNRQGREIRRQLFAAIANCGFPEASQNATALTICETFAGQTGFEWAGSMALGGGEVITGMPLDQGGGRTMRIRKSLELAAASLVKGQPISRAAREMMGKPAIPNWVYRMMGALSWRKQAKRFGVHESINNQPYLGKP
jgi:multimeric flavodoxin WrbA